MFGAYMHQLQQKNNTHRAFKESLEENYRDVRDKFDKAKKEVNSLKLGAFNQINAVMTNLGIPVS